MRAGDALDRIVAEETADAAAFERDQRARSTTRSTTSARTLLILLALAVAPGRSRSSARRTGVLGRETRDRLRPRVRAGAARPTSSPRSCRRSSRQGPRRRLARVHGDALRPDPPRPLQGDAGHDRRSDLGRAAHEDDRRPRADARRGRSSSSRSRRRSPTSSTTCSRGEPERLSSFRDRITEDRTEQSKRVRALQGARSATPSRSSAGCSSGGLRRSSSAAGVRSRRRRGAARRSAIHRFQLDRDPLARRRPASRSGSALLVERGVLVRRGLPFVRVWRRCRPDGRARRPSAGRRSAATSPTSRGSTWRRPPRSSSGSATSSTGSRSASPSGCSRAAQLAHARGAPPRRAPSTGSAPTSDLGSGPSRARDRRPQRRLRQRARAAVERLGRRRRRLLGRRRGRRRRRRRRRLVAIGAGAGARRARPSRPSRRSGTRPRRRAGSTRAGRSAAATSGGAPRARRRART